MEKKINRDYFIRLIIGLFINLMIVFPIVEQLYYGGHGFYTLDDGSANFQLTLIGGAIFAIIMVLLGKVLLRGTSWQQTAAIVLMVFPVILSHQVIRCFLEN